MGTAGEACACWSAPEMTEASEAVKDCKIAEVSAIAQGLKACKNAFSTCRKYEDEAVASMAACSVPVSALKAKAAALSLSKSAMDAAAFITLVTTIVTIATDFPSSPMIVTISADIVASDETNAKKTLISESIQKTGSVSHTRNVKMPLSP